MKYADWKKRYDQLTVELTAAHAPYSRLIDERFRHAEQIARHYTFEPSSKDGRVWGRIEMYIGDGGMSIVQQGAGLHEPTAQDLNRLRAAVALYERWKAGEVDEMPPSGEW